MDWEQTLKIENLGRFNTNIVCTLNIYITFVLSDVHFNLSPAEVLCRPCLNFVPSLDDVMSQFFVQSILQ